jgi:anthranilate phosphoribosyltransferase
MQEHGIGRGSGQEASAAATDGRAWRLRMAGGFRGVVRSFPPDPPGSSTILQPLQDGKRRIGYNARIMQTGAFPILDALALVAEGRDLTREQAREVIRLIMEGSATQAQIGALLMGLRMKGESVEEMAGAAEAMRELATPVVSSRRPLLDTCGTGGDGRGTYNISTAVAFVAVACGVAVAKHGNRSVSSRSGSADVLEAAGVRIDLSAEEMGRCLDEVGLAFLFAPLLHGAMRHAIGPRRELRLRTLFNLLGPLTNPAGAELQLLGVYNSEKARLMAGVLRNLGSRGAWVVHGLDGCDELSVCEDSIAFCVTKGEEIRELRVRPEDAGIARGLPGAIAGGDPKTNADWLIGLLSGGVRDASRDMVVLNAAAALMVAGRAGSLAEGRALAEEAIDSARARGILDRLREVTRKL